MANGKTVILFGVVVVMAVVAATAGAKWFLMARAPATPAPTPELLKLYGGRNGFAVIQKPDRIEAFRVSDPKRSNEPIVTEGPVAVTATVAQELVSVLSSHQAYGWDYAKGCVPEWGVRLAFYRGTDRVDILLCFQCDLLMVSLNGTETTRDVEDFDPIRPNLVRAIKQIFPNDPALQSLPEKH
jgi:hypothetical protein